MSPKSKFLKYRLVASLLEKEKETMERGGKSHPAVFTETLFSLQALIIMNPTVSNVGGLLSALCDLMLRSKSTV